MSEEAIQDTGSQEIAGGAASAPVSFLDSLSEDLRSSPSVQKFTDVNGMAKSYINLEQMVGADKVAKPSKSWTDDQYNEFYNSVGRPESSDGYDFDLDGIANPEAAGALRQAMWEAGLQPRQASRLAEFISQSEQSSVAQRQEQLESAVFEAEQTLRADFGQAYDQRVGMAQGAARTLLGEEGMDLFESVKLSDGRALGDLPEVVKMFANLAEKIGEDKLVGEPTELIMTPDQALSEANKMMLEGAYTEKHHPQHKHYVEEVERLFKLAYP